MANSLSWQLCEQDKKRMEHNFTPGGNYASHRAIQFATRIRNGTCAVGIDIGTFAKLMGHSGPTMLLEHYKFVMDKQKRAAVESLPEITHVPNPCAQKKEKDLRFFVSP